MEWQIWVAPTFVGVILGLVVSYLTARQTRKHAEKMFRLGRAAKLEDDLRALGVPLAERMVDQLEILRDNLPYLIWGRFQQEPSDRCDAALRELRRASILHPSPGLRERFAHIHDVLGSPDSITQWGRPSYAPDEVVRIGLTEGTEGISAYLRGDEAPPSDALRALYASYELAMQDLAEQHAEFDRMEREH